MPDDDLPERIAGLPVVRVVGRSSRATMVLLRHPDGLLARVWNAGLPRSEVDRELAALTRVAHPHVMPVIDAETLADGRVAAVVPRLSRGSATRFLERRQEVSLREAITLIAPVAGGMDALHGAGVVHGRLAAHRVLLDDSGAPVLVGFGAAELIDSGISPAVRAPRTSPDIDALHRFADTVLTHVRAEDADRARAVREELSASVRGEPGAAIQAALFAVDTGGPLRFDEVPMPSRVAAGSGTSEWRQSLSSVPPDPGADGPTAGRARPRRRASRSTARPPRAGRSNAPRTDRLSRGVETARRVWAGVGQGRRRALAAAGAAGIAALIALALVPGGDSADGADRAAPSAPLSGPRPVPSATPSNASRGESSAPTPAPSTAGASDPVAIVRGEDAVAAVAVLLATRERCVRDPDPSCVADVDEPGSPLASRDLVATARPVFPAGPYRTIDEWGGAAVIGANPYRVLVVRTDAGWRIRDITDADGATR